MRPDWAAVFRLAGAKRVTTRSTGLVRALCLFHAEKTPSMFGWPGGGFYCFGCQAGGRSPEDFARMRLELDDDAEEANDGAVGAWLACAEPVLPGQLDLPFVAT